jgi:hypothetical protein
MPFFIFVTVTGGKKTRALPKLMNPAGLPQRLEADCFSSFAAGINALLHPARDTATLEPL